MPRTVRLYVALVAVVLSLALTSPPAEGARVLRVPSEFLGIQAAVDAAEHLDTVLVAPGTYSEGVVISSGRGGLVLKSEKGPKDTILQGTPGSRIVTLDEVDTLTEISGFTLRRGDPQFDGGAIYAYRSQILVANCEISGNNTQGDGGAIALYESWALIWKNIISANAARQGGAIFANGSTVTLAGNTFRNNQARQDGGALLLLSSECTVNNNAFFGNRAEQSGGGVAFMSPEGEFRANTLRNNRARQGGGFYCQGGYQPDLTSNRFSGNQPSDLAGCSSGRIQE